MAGESLEKTCFQKVGESIFFSGLKTEKKDQNHRNIHFILLMRLGVFARRIQHVKRSFKSFFQKMKKACPFFI
jgi:hypothetical protein